MVKKAGDWALEGTFQWIQAQAVPEFDSNGIGRGNSKGNGLYILKRKDEDPFVKTTTQTATGSGNFYGFEIDALYAFTNNLTMEQNVKLSWTLDKNIGPNINYRQWEVEFIYAF
jgi:hypothetical protein